MTALRTKPDTGMAHTPDRIRVGQDADGFWTCREAVSGSQEYVRADLVDDLLSAIAPFAEAWSIATAYPSIVQHLTMAQLGKLAAHEVTGIHFRNARSAERKATGAKP
jgi:hypothetical protein